MSQRENIFLFAMQVNYTIMSTKYTNMAGEVASGSRAEFKETSLQCQLELPTVNLHFYRTVHNDITEWHGKIKLRVQVNAFISLS